MLKSLLLVLLILPSKLCACDEKTALALNMYHEARGEGVDGMAMVGEVTLNRVAHPRFPNTVCEVVYQRNQFSWTHSIKDHTPKEEIAWTQALELSEQILNNEYEMFNTGATHYLNPSLVTRLPKWAKQLELIGRVGNHLFYRM